METDRIWVGIGGWEHEVLDGCLYGTREGSTTDRLLAYARTFDLTEVRATFWDDTLAAADAARWSDAVAENRRFLFTVKLHSTFTHRRAESSRAARSLRSLLGELLRRNRLGAVLAQFPYAFTNTGTNRFFLGRVAEQFRGFPLQMEFRHSSWNTPSLYEILGDLGVTPVSCDMPRVRQFMPYHTGATGETAYLRLHGRNERGWLIHALDSRYDYLYNSKEIQELRRRTEAVAGSDRKVLVVFNNTTGGKAVANALQLMSALRGGKLLPVPSAAIRAFPFLETIASRRAGTLFEDPAYREAM